MATAPAAKLLQSCLTLCDPIDGSPPGSPIPGILQQAHWSGLPFPSPMHESEKWRWSCSVMSDSVRTHGLQSTRFLCPWDFPGKTQHKYGHSHCIHKARNIYYSMSWELSLYSSREKRIKNICLSRYIIYIYIYIYIYFGMYILIYTDRYTHL